MLEYFIRNPEAADSLEGIARWRMQEQVVHRTVTETAEALEWLVEQGYLLKSARKFSGLLYTLNPDKAADAKRIVKAKE